MVAKIMSNNIGCRNAIDLSSEWGQEQIKKAYKLIGNGGYMPAKFEGFNTESHMACLVNALLCQIETLEIQKVNLQEQIEAMNPYLEDAYFEK